jgi:hypothetical protein
MSYCKNINDSNNIVLRSFINEVLQDVSHRDTRVLSESFGWKAGAFYIGMLGGLVAIGKRQQMTKDMTPQFWRDVIADVSLEGLTAVGYALMRSGSPKKGAAFLAVSAVSHVIYYGDIAGDIGIESLDREEAEYLAACFGMYPALGVASYLGNLKSGVRARAAADLKSAASLKGEALLNKIRTMSIKELSEGDVLLRILSASEADKEVCFVLLSELGGGGGGAQALKAGAKKFQDALDLRSIRGLHGLDGMRESTQVIKSNIKNVIDADVILEPAFWNNIAIDEIRSIEAKVGGYTGTIEIKRISETEYKAFYTSEDAMGSAREINININEYLDGVSNHADIEALEEVFGGPTSGKLSKRVLEAAKESQVYKNADHWLSTWMNKIVQLTEKSQGLGLKEKHIGDVAQMDLGAIGPTLGTIEKVDDVHFFTSHTTMAKAGGMRDALEHFPVGKQISSTTGLAGWRKLNKIAGEVPSSSGWGHYSGVVMEIEGKKVIKWRKIGADPELTTWWQEFKKLPAAEAMAIIFKVGNRGYQGLFDDEYLQGKDITYPDNW